MLNIILFKINIVDYQRCSLKSCLNEKIKKK